MTDLLVTNFRSAGTIKFEPDVELKTILQLADALRKAPFGNQFLDLHVRCADHGKFYIAIIFCHEDATALTSANDRNKIRNLLLSKLGAKSESKPGVPAGVHGWSIGTVLHMF
mgnify:CR=1 FL=1